jgi:starvation-inducible DNA-binding protein
MSSIQTASHLPALAAPHEREADARQLEGVAQELIDLGLVGGQLRWAVVGPHARTLRQEVDELVAAWRALADQLAARTVALGHVPAVAARGVVDGSTVPTLAAGPIEDGAAVWELTHRVSQVSERARERAARVGAMDTTSEAVLIEVVGVLEEHQWLLRTQLGARRRGTQ